MPKFDVILVGLTDFDWLIAIKIFENLPACNPEALGWFATPSYSKICINISDMLAWSCFIWICS